MIKSSDFQDLKWKLRERIPDFAETVQPIFEANEWTHKDKGVPDVNRIEVLTSVLLTKISLDALNRNKRTYARSGRVTVEIRERMDGTLEGQLRLSAPVRERVYR